MLRPQKRSPDQPGTQAEDAPIPQETELPGTRAHAPEAAAENGRKPRNAQSNEEHHVTRAPRTRLLVGTALALLGTGGLLSGAVAVGAHFGVPIPFVNDTARVSVPSRSNVPAVASARKEPLALTPPALGTPDVSEKQAQEPSVAQSDDPFAGEGMSAPIDPLPPRSLRQSKRLRPSPRRPLSRTKRRTPQRFPRARRHLRLRHSQSCQ